MTVNQTEKKFFDVLEKQKLEIDPKKPSLPQLRRYIRKIFRDYAGAPSNVTYQNLNVIVRDGSSISVRVFNPNETSKITVFLGGNAFLFNIYEENTVAASRIAKLSGTCVYTVDHRLMPEVTWPTPIDDIEDVLAPLCGKAETKINLVGICSGAQAAMLIALRNNPKIHLKKLILLNGLYDQSLSQNAYSEAEKHDKMINRETLDWWFKHYSFSKQASASPSNSPLFANNFSSLPETYILTAEHDGFRSDSEALFVKLLNHNVPVTKEILPGQTHNTLLLRGAMHEGQDPAELISQLIKE